MFQALQISFQNYAISSYYLLTIKQLSFQHILALNFSKDFSDVFVLQTIVDPNIVNFIFSNRIDDFW